jgi:hypothetical protein
MLGNCVVNRYLVNNLVIGSIGAVATVEVTVTVSSGGLVVGDIGVAVPRAAFTGGVAVGPVRVVTATTFVIPFINASAGALDPADTFEFDVFIFRGTGNLTQSV